MGESVRRGIIASEELCDIMRSSFHALARLSKCMGSTGQQSVPRRTGDDSCAALDHLERTDIGDMGLP